MRLTVVVVPDQTSISLGCKAKALDGGGIIGTSSS